MIRLALGVVALAFAATAGFAEDMTVATANSLKWGPAPPALPKGAQLAVLVGDPGSNGPYVVRVKVPAGYTVPAHNHPNAENLTIVPGTFNVGMGDRVDKKHAQVLKAGSFVSMPAKMNHYAWATSAVVLQIHGEGPFAINYVNPADDPSKGGSASR